MELQSSGYHKLQCKTQVSEHQIKKKKSLKKNINCSIKMMLDME